MAIASLKIVLLRGLAREAEHWRSFPEQLQAQFAHRFVDQSLTILTPDFPGCGVLHDQSALSSIAAMTDQLRSFLNSSAQNENQNEPKQTQKLLLVGLSMGGMVALDYAQRFADEVEGIVLINSSTGADLLWRRLKPAVWLRVPFILSAPIFLREQWILKLVSNDRETWVDNCNHWQQIQRRHPVSRQTFKTMLKAASRFKPPKTCSVPGLVLSSDNDHLVSPLCSGSIAATYGWPIHTHPEAGHDLALDAPNWVVSQMLDWLEINQTSP